MRAKKENFIKGAHFHIYNHAIDNILLFKKDKDYIQCLKKIKIKVKIYPASIFAYCLMPNHYHFFLRQDSEKPVYRIFNDVFAGYVQYYNKKYYRKGPLFQHSLQHIAINDNRYALRLCQYIHYNPVKAGLVSKPENWIYSNYLEWIGKRNGTLFSGEIMKNNDITPAIYEEMMNSYNQEHLERDLEDYIFDE